MCKTFEDLAEKRADENVQEDRRVTAKILLSRGSMTVEEIAAVSRLSLEEVEELAGLQPVKVDC